MALRGHAQAGRSAETDADRRHERLDAVLGMPMLEADSAAVFITLVGKEPGKLLELMGQLQLEFTEAREPEER